jgi:hypothetical protein
MSTVDFDEPDELVAQDSAAADAGTLLRRVARDLKAAESKELGYSGWAEQYRAAAELTQRAAAQLASAAGAMTVAAGYARLAGVDEGTGEP